MSLIALNSVYLDLETTGLNRNGMDEILELALVGPGGDALLHTFLKPERVNDWAEAQDIHGISPEAVKDSPALSDVLGRLVDSVRGRQLVIYNAPYDLSFLPPEVSEAASEVRCCMLPFAEHYGEWDESRGSFKWKKLVFAAEHVGHEWSGSAHSALADAQATRSVWQWLVSRGAA